MNCHDDNKNAKGAHNHSPLKHMLHMILCCGLPIVVLALLPIISGFSPAAGNVVSKIAPFLCPIMMISMLLMMFGGNKNKSCCSNADEENKTLEPDKN